MKSICLCLSCAALALAASAIEVDGVAARVDSATILKSDVIAEMRRSGADPSQYADVVQDMVERRLVLKAAGESKMTMQEWVIDNRLREIVQSRFGGDRNKLMEVLRRQKVSYPEWRQKMKDDMVVAAMRWQTIDRTVTATPSELREEFSKHRDRYAIGGKTTVSVILLKPEDAAKRAEISAALANTPFAELAKRHSADSHAAEGGVWKDVTPADVFRPEVCAELSRMPVGTLSTWIDLDGWSFLLRKDAETKGRERSFTEAYDDVEGAVRAEKASKLYAEWIARLKAASYVKIY